jgi:hypothetical protein
VSPTTQPAEGQRGLAEKLGLQPGWVVQELGHNEDVDLELRQAVQQLVGSQLVGPDYEDVVDAVLLWWRADDGDLVDALVDALGPLTENGFIWLFTPKSGRPGHVEPSDVTEAAPTAGLTQTTSLSAGRDWSGARLVSPRSSRAEKRR